MSAAGDSFPLLEEMKSKGSFAYLDNAATTQKPERVIKAVDKFYRESNSNVHRGVYSLSERATQSFEDARKTVARFLNSDSEEVIFTSGATAALNLLAESLSHCLQPEDTILLTESEHHSNLLPWLRVAENRGCKVSWLPVLDDGSFDLAAFREILASQKVKIFAFANVSHVFGNRHPAESLIAEAKKHGAWTVVDATQAVARERLDVKALRCDALVFSGHKVYGPSGVGVLFASKDLEAQMKPFHLGGGMVERITKSEPASWRKAPWKFEAGTPPIEGAIGLAEALKFVAEADVLAHASRERELVEQLAAYLSGIEGVRLYGWASGYESLAGHKLTGRELGHGFQPHEGILSFSLDGLHPHDVAQTLADEGVAVRAGHHCAQVLTDKFAPEGCVRVSLAVYNSDHDLELFKTAFEKCLTLRSEMTAAVHGT